MNRNQTERTRGNILIVDDTPENLQVLSNTLSEQGYKVRCVVKGQMAIRAARSAPPDLILLDIKMPDMDGFEVCDRLKGDAQTSEIPVIFLSALDEVLDKVKAFSSGGADYITKPFQVEEVLARIKNQLIIQKLSKQLQEQNAQLQHEIETRKQTETQLQREIAERQQAQHALRQAYNALEAKLEEQLAEREKLLKLLNSLQNFSYEYQVGGSLPSDARSYCLRQADDDLYQALLHGEFCYVLNSRQMGKSSLRVRTMNRLQRVGICCGTIDITAIGTQQVSLEQWYASVIGYLVSSFQLKCNLRSWWRGNEAGCESVLRAHLSPVSRLAEFIEQVLLVEIEQPIVIFIDEIDSVLGLEFPIDDFFSLIRACYNKRAENPAYKRLTFALFGVATPANFVSDAKRTPFNIGRAIELKGFERHEAMSLASGLAEIVAQPEVVLEQILQWTGGQPFLTQKLCKLIQTTYQDKGEQVLIDAGEEAAWVEQLVLEQIIDNWEANDEPEHLKTIRDRLLKNEQRVGRLLGLYQKILTPQEEDRKTSLIQNLNRGIAVDDSQEQIELLLSGLVVKCDGRIRVRNPIYAAVFNPNWVDKQLEKLRPYAEMFNAWMASSGRDESWLLRGQALRDAQAWAASHCLSDQDYKFFAASYELERKEEQQTHLTQKAKDMEARTLYVLMALLYAQLQSVQTGR